MVYQSLVNYIAVCGEVVVMVEGLPKAGEELKKTAEEKTKAEKKAKAEEFKLPEDWTDKLPDLLQRLGNGITDIGKTVTGLSGRVSAVEDALKPEPIEPCPGCESEIPKSKLPEVEQRLKQRYGKVEHVVVPRDVEKEKVVEKPVIGAKEFEETAKRAFPERPSDETIGALQRFSEKARERGWLKE